MVDGMGGYILGDFVSFFVVDNLNWVEVISFVGKFVNIVC